MAHEIECKMVEKFIVDGVEFKTLEDAKAYSERCIKADDRKARRAEVEELAAWWRREVRAAGLPYDSRGCAEFMLLNSDKVVERLGYEVIEVD